MGGRSGGVARGSSSSTDGKGSNKGSTDIANKRYQWTRSSLASGKTVTVRVEDIDKNWSTDRVGKGGSGGIGERYTEAKKFLQENTKVNMSEVTVRKNGEIVFTDGRHRFAALRDAGRKTIQVVMRDPKNYKGDFL